MPIIIQLDEVKSLLPHRYPFLFLNGVEIDVSGGTKKGLMARAILPPGAMEFWLQGPERTFPPVLAIEFFAQMIGVAFLQCNPECRDRPCYLASMEKVAFECPIIAGVVVEGEVVICGSTPDALKARGTLYSVDNKIPLVTGAFTCGFPE